MPLLWVSTVGVGREEKLRKGRSGLSRRETRTASEDRAVRHVWRSQGEALNAAVWTQRALARGAEDGGGNSGRWMRRPEGHTKDLFYFQRQRERDFCMH